MFNWNWLCLIVVCCNIYFAQTLAKLHTRGWTWIYAHRMLLCIFYCLGETELEAILHCSYIASEIWLLDFTVICKLYFCCIITAISSWSWWNQYFSYALQEYWNRFDISCQNFWLLCVVWFSSLMPLLLTNYSKYHQYLQLKHLCLHQLFLICPCQPTCYRFIDHSINIIRYMVHQLLLVHQPILLSMAP